jgi:phenylalanyl-tRNA synthetase beta chain
MRRALQDAAASLGLHETLTYSLVAKGDHTRWGRSAAEVIHLANPMTTDRAEMRVTLLGGHLEAVKRNRASGVDSIALFEISRTYNAVPSIERDQHNVPAYSTEREVLALCVARAAVGKSFDAADGIPTDFSLGLGYVRALLGRVGADVSFEPFTSEHVNADSFLHPGQRARVVVGGRHAGWVGVVHPLRADEYDIDDCVVAAEVDLGVVEQALTGSHVYTPISTYPPVRQDIAVVLPTSVLAGVAVAVAKEAGGAIVESVVPFDRYEGEHVAEGHYSLALRVAFRAPDRTLTEDDALTARNAVIAGLSDKLGATLR